MFAIVASKNRAKPTVRAALDLGDLMSSFQQATDLDFDHLRTTSDHLLPHPTRIMMASLGEHEV